MDGHHQGDDDRPVEAGEGATRLPWQRPFLDSLVATLNVAGAARAAGVSRARAYAARAEDPGFASAWDDAVEEALDRAEGEVYRRGVEGVDEPVYFKGKPCGVIRKYSDAMLVFLLRGRRRELYGDRVRQEHTGPGDGPIRIGPQDLTKLTDAELEALARGGGPSRPRLGG